jgi:drug/metabolite transporter (DMT)-like permease
VIGKSVLEKLSPSVVTFWRYFFGFITLVVVLFATHGSLGLKEFGGALDAQAWRALFYIAIGPGLIAMLLYYKGMTRASAMTTTFMELLFPITAVGINTFYLDQPLNPVQACAAIVLLFAVTMISLGERRSP